MVQNLKTLKINKKKPIIIYSYRKFKNFTKKLKNSLFLNYKENKFVNRQASRVVYDNYEKLNICKYFQDYKYSNYFINNINKVRLIKNIQDSSVYNTYTIFDTLQNLSNLLLFKKLTNLIMYDGKKSKAENILLKTFEILKSDYRIVNPLYKLKFLIYKNLVPHILPKIIKVKKKKKLKKDKNKDFKKNKNIKKYKEKEKEKEKEKDDKKDEEKTIGVFKDIHYRLNLSLKLYIKGARNMVSSIAYGLVIEFLNLLKSQSFLQDFNKKTIKTLKDLHLYFVSRYKMPKNKPKKFIFKKKKK